MRVNQEKVKELLVELVAEVENVSDEDEYMEAMDAIETLKEILQMN